ncbi:MAG: hypothetical protein ACR2P3_05230 [Geminicoccaceae bacterium]
MGRISKSVMFEGVLDGEPLFGTVTVDMQRGQASQPAPDPAPVEADDADEAAADVGREIMSLPDYDPAVEVDPDDFIVVVHNNRAHKVRLGRLPLRGGTS